MNPALGASAIVVLGTLSVLTLIRNSAPTSTHDRLPSEPVGRDAGLTTGIEAWVARLESSPLGRVDARTAAPAMAISVVVSGALGHAGPVLAVAAGLAGVRAGRRWLDGWQRRGFDAGVPALVEGIAASLRAGSGLAQAISDGADAAGGPVSADGRLIARRLRSGESLGDSLRWWERRRPGPDMGIVVALAEVGTHLGGPLADTFDEVSVALRDRRTVEAESAALATQAKASAMLLSALPVGALAVVGLADPRVVDFLLRSGAGAACLVVGGVLEMVGIVWMNALVRGAR